MAAKQDASAPGRRAATNILVDDNVTLTRVSDFPVTGLWQERREPPNDSLLAQHIGGDSTYLAGAFPPAERETGPALWERLAAALQRVRALEQEDAEKTEALSQSCTQLTEVCASWNQQRVELQIAHNEIDMLGGVIAEQNKIVAEKNKIIESQQTQLQALQRQLASSEQRRRALERQAEERHDETSQNTQHLLDVEVELKGKTAALEMLQDRLAQVLGKLEEAERSKRGALDSQYADYESKLRQKDGLIARKNQEIKELQAEQREAAGQCDRFRSEQQALEEDNRRAHAKIGSLIEHIDQIVSTVERDRVVTSKSLEEMKAELNREHMQRMVVEVALERAQPRGFFDNAS